jgi:hypothetical protein
MFGALRNLPKLIYMLGEIVQAEKVQRFQQFIHNKNKGNIIIPDQMRVQL